MTNTEFGKKLGEIMNVEILTGDSIWQEELFEMQKQFCKLICDAANEGNKSVETIANSFVKQNKQLFNQE